MYLLDGNEHTAWHLALADWLSEEGSFLKNEGESLSLCRWR